MTNYEWLKTLSVDDLAENIRHKCRLCTFYNADFSCGGEQDCLRGISGWLREEHKEEIREKLKPCPFCNGEVELCETPMQGWTEYKSVCTNCDATIMGMFDDKEKAVEAWNRRAGE